MTVARKSQPSHVGMYVMSPTIFSPGASAVKSRSTRSGMSCSWPSPSVRLTRHGRRAPAHELRMHPPVPVRVIGILERLPDIQREYPAPFRRRRFRFIAPAVKTGTRHRHPDAHFHDRRHVLLVRLLVSGVLHVDELELVAHR